MGITGLLPFLKNIQKDVHVSAFRGKKVAVDAYCWLHKGAYTCAMQLVMKTEKVDKLPFITYCMKRVNLLRQHEITPVMVFDGGYLPSKSKTEKGRREKRQSYREKGKALLKDGKRSEAFDCFQKCVDVSPEMALAFIKECRGVGVECIVAPYEADAQLAYLQKEGIVDLVITEDSDLLVFGCKQVLFKLDDSGNGKLIQLRELGKANNTLIGFTEESFRQMCILSGCDYLPSIPGIGLGKASKLMRKYNLNPYRMIRLMQSETSKVPKDYEVEFRKAEHTFLYQVVFDPRTQAQVPLTPLPADVDPSDLQFCGAVSSSPRKAVGMARGNINPFTHEVMDDYSPSKAPPPKSTSWNASAMGSANKQYPLAVQGRLPLASSQGSQRDFRPPKRTRSLPVEDASLKDEDLQSLYSDDREVKPQCETATISRFFQKQGGSETTPSDGGIPRTAKAVRKLQLSALEEGGSQTDGVDESERVDSLQAMSFSVGPTDGAANPSVPESPVDESPLHSRSGDSDRNRARKRLLERYKYSKKRKTETTNPSDTADPTTEGGSFSLPINPFSTASVKVGGSFPCTPQMEEDSRGLPSPDPPVSQPMDSEVGNIDQYTTTDSTSQRFHPFMTSDDFISTPNPGRLSDTGSMSLATGNMSCASEVDVDLPSSTISQMVTRPQSSNVDVVDLTSEITELCTTVGGAVTPRPCSMLLSALTTRRASSDNPKRRKGPKAGLARRSSSSARFKPPRPVDQTGVSQSLLSQFTYQKKPQMT